MGNMRKSGLEGGEEARAVSVGNFKHREDLETYRQLPDYDESLRYDMGIDAV